MTIRGTDLTTVRSSLDAGEPFPGTFGFAGEFDGTLCRDVLGREPLFVDTDSTQPRWAFTPDSLEQPRLFPAGWTMTDDRADQVWTLPSRRGSIDHGSAANRIETAIELAIDDVQISNAAIAFSGGVDSALLGAMIDAPLFVVGFPDSHDVTAAKRAAASFDRPLQVVELDHDRLREALPRVVEIIGRPNAMDVQIAMSLYLLGQAVADAGYDRLILGQGADEVFGGYEKVRQLDHRVEADTIDGAIREQLRSLPDQLPRDVLAVRSTGIEPITPYLHDEVVRTALSVPTSSLIDRDNDIQKSVLREVASGYLPSELAYRPKKAIQYGSYVSRELDRLARRSGFKRRMDQHVTRYIEQFVEDSGTAWNPWTDPDELYH